jgi:DNA polymerase III gamma/tau subunit
MAEAGGSEWTYTTDSSSSEVEAEKAVDSADGGQMVAVQVMMLHSTHQWMLKAIHDGNARIVDIFAVGTRLKSGGTHTIEGGHIPMGPLVLAPTSPAPATVTAARATVPPPVERKKPRVKKERASSSSAADMDPQRMQQQIMNQQLLMMMQQQQQQQQHQLNLWQGQSGSQGASSSGMPMKGEVTKEELEKSQVEANLQQQQQQQLQKDIAEATGAAVLSKMEFGIAKERVRAQVKWDIEQAKLLTARQEQEHSLMELHKLQRAQTSHTQPPLVPVKTEKEDAKPRAASRSPARPKRRRHSRRKAATRSSSSEPQADSTQGDGQALRLLSAPRATGSCTRLVRQKDRDKRRKGEGRRTKKKRQTL